MRRQLKPQGLAARWPVRPLDIDPFSLPARYALAVGEAAGGKADQDTILITKEEVAVERALGGVPMRASLKVSDFRGVAMRIAKLPLGDDAFAISVNLHHEEPDLCFPLHMAFDFDDAGARWQSWGRALRLPLLMPTPEGGWREPDDAPGKWMVRPAMPRPPRLALRKRRSRMSAVREVGHMDGLAVIRGTEIIARN